MKVSFTDEATQCPSLALCLLVNVSSFFICFAFFTSENLFMRDISATAELNAVHCVTGSILRIMKRAGRGVPVPVGCEICWQN